MRVVITLISFLCLFQASLQGQNKVKLSGKVTDLLGMPIPGATIAIEQNSNGTQTNDNGDYTLPLKTGKHTIIVSSLGFNTIKTEIHLTTSQSRNFILEENTINLQTLHVYGKTKTQQTREGAFSANALDVKPIISSINNINTIVNRTTGIKVREEGGVGSDFELSINGMSGNSVRYFIDGMPLSSKGSGISLANLPVNIIDRVEIYKGVVPSYLGADALGGAVNIITKQEKTNYLDVSYGIGSFHTHKGDLYGQYINKKTGIIFKPTIGVNYSKNDYMMKGIELWDETDREFKKVNRKRFHDNYLSLLTQLEAGVIQKKWADAFFISGSFSSINKDLQTGSIQSIVYGKAERETEAWNISARYSKKDFLIRNLQLNLSASHTWDHSITIDTTFRKYKWDGSFIESSRNEITGRDKSIRHYKRPLTIVRANFDYTISADHTLNLNYLLNRTGNKRYDEIDTDFVPSNDILAKHIIGLSYNQSLINKRLNNTFFVKNYINHLKIEQQDLSWITGSTGKVGPSTENNIGYGIGTRYNFFNFLSLKASYEHSVRLPLARELLGNGTTIYANINLKPENSNNYNLGLFGTINLSNSHQLYYETNAFFRNVKDYIHITISEAEGLSQYDNVSSVDIKGIEGELRYNYSNLLQVIANCSYQDARSMTRYYPDGSPMITYKNKIPNRPWLFSNIEVNFTKRDLLFKNSTFRAGYNFEYVHWFYLTWEGYGNLESKSHIPTQYIHNLVVSLSFKRDKYNLSFTCNNLLDRTVYDNFMLQKPGRSFFCKLRVFIK